MSEISLSWTSHLYLSPCLPYNVTTWEWAWKWEHISFPSIHLPIWSSPAPCSHFSILCTCHTCPFELVSNPVLLLCYWVTLDKSHNLSEPFHLWNGDHIYIFLCEIMPSDIAFLCLSPLLFGPFTVHILWSLVFHGWSLKGALMSLSPLAAPACCTERLQELGTLPNKLNQIFWGWGPEIGIF